MVDDDWWGVTLLIALGTVVGMFLLALFVWYAPTVKSCSFATRTAFS